MNKSSSSHVIVLVLLILAAYALVVTTQTSEVAIKRAPRQIQIDRVLDGDSLWLMVDGKQLRTRLARIDAPEKDQPFGREATDELVKLATAGRLKIEKLGRDRYGRELIFLFNEDGQNLNLLLVSNGFAWCTRSRGSNSQIFYRLCRTEERKARRERLGLWSDADPIPPWKYRMSHNPRQRSQPSGGSYQQ